MSDKQRSDAYSAYSIAKDPIRFSVWAKSVKLDTRICLDTCQSMPDVLKDIINKSLISPRWVSNKDASQYNSCPKDLVQYLEPLAEVSETIFPAKSDDKDLSEDVMSCIGPILSIIQQDRVLASLGHEANEADRRCALDYLMMYTWNIQASADFVHRLECRLQVPKASPYRIHEAKADSTVFIKTREPGLTAWVPQMVSGCSSMVPGNLTQTYTRVLHWVSEYKRQSDEDVSQRQVMEGLVSGLYQRRALGFGDHFIFGMAHHSNSDLDLIAATWSSTIGEARSNCRCHGVRVDILDSSFDRDEIVIYRLCRLSMKSPAHMLHLYLLLRAVRTLGLQYQTDMQENIKTKLTQQHKADPRFFSWPETPKKPPPSEHSSKRQRGLSSVDEEYEARHEMCDAHSTDSYKESHEEPSSATDSVKTWEAEYRDAISLMGPGIPIASSAIKHLEGSCRESMLQRYLSTSLYEYEPLPPNQPPGQDHSCS